MVPVTEFADGLHHVRRMTPNYLLREWLSQIRARCSCVSPLPTPFPFPLSPFPPNALATLDLSRSLSSQSASFTPISRSIRPVIILPPLFTSPFALPFFPSHSPHLLSNIQTPSPQSTDPHQSLASRSCPRSVQVYPVQMILLSRHQRGV